MRLLAGADAEAAVRAACANERLLGLAVYPLPPARGPVQLVALATEQAQLLVDAGRTPGLWTALAEGPPVASYLAKPLARTLLRQRAPLPARWAALEIGYQLLRAGPPAEPTLAQIAEQLRLQAPPESLEAPLALAERAAFYRAAALRQAQALRRRSAVAVSRLEAAAVAPLARLEAAGMRLDEAKLRRLMAAERAELAQLTAQLAAGLKLDPAAFQAGPQSLLAALRRAGHPVATLDDQALTAALHVAEPARAAQALLRHAALARLHPALGDALLGHLDPKDGRVHATFVQLGAHTGRMACRTPNLQGIPKAFARRACFVPEPGHAFVLADYAACELRILAEMSSDAAYLAAFARGDDVHAQVAETMFARKVTRQTEPKLREAAKTVSFGLVYGMQPQGLAGRLGCSLSEAQALADKFFAAYPQVRAYLHGSEEAALARGYTETLAGRRLRLPAVGPGRAEGAVRRLARNAPIQGTGADLIKLALAGTQRLLDAHYPDARLVHCVHDALVVECPAPLAAQLGRAVGEAMRQAGAQLLRQVDTVADVEIADAWR